MIACGWGRVTASIVAVVMAAASVAGDDQEDAVLREMLRRRIEMAATAGGLRIADEAIHTVVSTTRFYEARAFAPAWTARGRPTTQSHQLLAAVEKTDAEGLPSDAYHRRAIERRLAALESDSTRPPDVRSSRMVELELMLTDAFILYGSHLLSGRVDPQTIDAEWLATPRSGDMARILESALAAGDVERSLIDLLPPQPGYAGLKAALGRLRAVAEAGGWPTIPTDETLRLNDRNIAVSTLRDRLRIGGDLADTEVSEPDLFDQDVEAAVRRFQARHGLEPDGVVGPATRAALDVQVEDRIEQVVVNLERWRWLPQDLGRRHLRINIAGFDLEARDGDRIDLEMRVITGRPYRRTPVFSDLMTYLVLNPSWTIPPKLAIEDKLPLIRKDPTYLARQGITVFSGWGADADVVDPATVDWAAVSARAFPYRLRQEPGPQNALGRIKFMFPNPFNVYLHDTPERGLFGRAARDFSSGCIRIQRPLELAEWLLGTDAEWTRTRIEELLATGEERTIRLSEPTPVHLLYWTAWAGPGDVVEFRPDLYGRDQSVLRALEQRPPA